MNPLQKIDGKKTIAAGGLSAIPAFMVALDMIWGFPEVYDKVVDTATLAIGVLGGLGVFHKVAKFMAAKGLK
jgi:hypothetical protein